MTDRKKVIKGLEDSFANQGCGYMDGVGKLYAVSGEDLQNAIALLKEQEPVEPIAIKQEMFDEFYGAVSCCPKCDCMWIMYMDNDMHYCPECGQAVKWDA